MIINEETQSNDELYHYGVMGMKWGIRKASGTISRSTSSAKTGKAIKSLNTHRSKASNKVEKLESKNKKLEVKVNKRTAKANKRKGKVHSIYFTEVGKQKADKNIRKAMAQEGKAAKYQKKINKNKKLQEMFNKGIGDIDLLNMSAGMKYTEQLLKEKR